MSASPKPELTELRIEEIQVVHNVRKNFDEKGLQQLAQSVLDRGIIEPLIVRFVVNEQGQAGYELVAGERRLRAARIAGLEKVPVIVRAFDPATAAKVQLIENLQRQDIDPIEEAEGFDRLVREHGVQAKEIAADLGVSEAHVSNRRRLLRLPDPVRNLVSAQKLSASVALSLVHLADYPDVAQGAAKVLVEGQVPQSRAERAVGDYLLNICPVVGGAGHRLKTADESAHKDCACRRKVPSGYGPSYAVCVDHAQFQAVEGHVLLQIEARREKRLQGKKGQPQGTPENPIDVSHLSSYGDRADYHTIEQVHDRAPGVAERHQGCACHRFGVRYGQSCEICIKPREFDRIERQAQRAHKKAVRATMAQGQLDAQAWVEQKVAQVWPEGAAQPTFTPFDLAYFAAGIVSAVAPAYGPDGRRAADASHYLRVFLGGEAAKARGPLLARHLATLDPRTVLRIAIEWPHLAGGLNLGWWYRHVAEHGLQDEVCDNCGQTHPIEGLVMYQVVNGHGMEQTGFPMGTWAYFCEVCRQGVWDTGLSLVNSGTGPLPGERLNEEQRAVLKQKAAERRARFGSVGMVEVEGDNEPKDEPGGEGE